MLVTTNFLAQSNAVASMHTVVVMLIFAAHKSVVIVERRIFGRMGLILTIIGEMGIHVEANVLLVEGQLVVLTRSRLLRALNSNNLLSSSGVQAFMKHFSLILNLMTMLRIGVVRNSTSRSLSISTWLSVLTVRHARSSVVSGRGRHHTRTTSAVISVLLLLVLVSQLLIRSR